jgi:hypothetical protein
VTSVGSGAGCTPPQVRGTPPPPWERFRITTLGVLAARPTWVASNHAALVLHGVAVHDVDLGHLDVAAAVTTTKRRRGLHVHRLAATDQHLLSAQPRAIDVATACVLTAAASGVSAGVVSMDAALHARRCTRTQIESALDHPGTRGGVARARAAVAAAEDGSESPGESLTRLALRAAGAEVQAQVDIHDSRGFVGRVDFLVGGRVVVEFDGAQKYGGAEAARVRAALAASAT